MCVRGVCLPGARNVIELPGGCGAVGGRCADLEGAGRSSGGMRVSVGRGDRCQRRRVRRCCAQVVVRRLREMWVWLREWLLEMEVERRMAGRVVEWTWHLWFGKELVL
jgi:hypothetical protein